ncbi:MAG: alpha/beta hydrolase [Acidimicrobiia bacterium]|nr:alpha/beta hydrolase [Actinomycetota bacterium]MBL6924873.1 alpha/beta hydrolase [Acidimicrobiia bacterium]MBL6927215.1 alpha/beta hydrolase [Acidimicrobiia bacterium]
MSGTGPSGGHIERDGLRIAFLDWGSGSDDADSEPLLVLHPSGFCAGTFDPFARRLKHRFRFVGVDLRGHGRSSTVTDAGQLGNDALAIDVLAVADHLGLERFSILGVSLGGGVGIEVAAAAPERVTSMMLCEAIAIDSVTREAHHFVYEDGQHPMAVAARRRRPVWPDRATVVASYGSRQPLCVLEPEILEAYVKWGFVDRPDGQVELACDPETEATFFGSITRYGPVEAFQHLVDVTCPTSVLVGTDTNLEMRWFEAQARRLDTDLVLVDGTHFFLFEDLDRGASLILKHLG